MDMEKSRIKKANYETKKVLLELKYYVSDIRNIDVNVRDDIMKRFKGFINDLVNELDDEVIELMRDEDWI